MDVALDHLANVVRQAVDGFHDKYEAWARILHWPVEAVKKNPGHARDLVTLTMARNAVVYHPASPAAHAPLAHKQPSQPQPRPQPARPLAPQSSSPHPQQSRLPLRSRPPNAWDQAFEAGKTWAHERWQDVEHTARHPILATAEAIARNRIVHTGNRYLDRAVDVVGGADAGVLARLIYGPAKIADLAIEYGPGKSPFIDTLIKKGVLKPELPLADRAYDVAAPLNRQAALRPPTTIPGKIVATTPTATAILAAPTVVAAAYAGVDGVGSAYDRARKAHAPAGAKTDAGIAASGLAAAGAATLQLRTLFGPDAAKVIGAMPEQMRGKAVDWVWRTAVKAGLGGALGGAHQAADNAIAKATYDPRRAPLEGVGTSALMAGITAAPFGLRGGRETSFPPQPRPPLPGPPVPLRAPEPFRYQRGGAHKDVKGIIGYEAHHMPANSVSPLSFSKGPAIAMTRADHKLTASQSSSGRSKAHLQREKDLIEAGDFAGAQDLAIEDIRSLHGNKYDEAIDQLIQHSKARGYRK